MEQPYPVVSAIEETETFSPQLREKATGADYTHIEVPSGISTGQIPPCTQLGGTQLETIF